MTPEETYAECRRRGISLNVRRDGTLIFTAPVGVLTPVLRQDLIANKQGTVNLINEEIRLRDEGIEAGEI